MYKKLQDTDPSFSTKPHGHTFLVPLQLLTQQTTQSTGTGTIQKLTNVTGSSLELTLPSKVSMKAEKLLYQPQRFSTITLCGYLAEKQHAMLHFFLYIKHQI